MFVDYYKELQIHPECDSDMIAKIRKIFAAKYHPDKAPASLKNEYTKKMQKINPIIDILIDPRLRREYDATHPYFNSSEKVSVEEEDADTYRKRRTKREERRNAGYSYADSFPAGIRQYLNAETLFKAAKKAKEKGVLSSFDRKHLYNFGKRVAGDREFTAWQKANIAKYIDMARKYKLL